MSQTDTSDGISVFATRFFTGTSLSKISGMLRDIAMGFYFGTSPSIAAFLVVFRFVYLARRLFGEGLIHQGFIPYFEELRGKDQKSGAIFFQNLFWTIASFLALILAICAGILHFFPAEETHLAIWMLPGVFFICLFGLHTGLLQSERSFFVPSVSPVVSNMVWILGIVLFHHLPISSAMVALAMTLSFGFFMQWVMTLPITWNYLKKTLSVKEILFPKFFHPGILRMLKPLFLGMIGVAAVQINSALDGIFARVASLEGPAYLWYAIRLAQLPLSLFAIAFSSALFPTLSRAFEKGEMDQFNQFFSFTRRKVIALIFPCVVGIFVLGLPSVNLIFGRGDFTSEGIVQTTFCLWGYGIGLLSMALVQIYAPAFYAKKDFHTPAKGFVFSALFHLLLNSLLVFLFHLGAISIALSTSLSSLLNLWYLRKKLRIPKEKDIIVFRILFAAVLSGAFIAIFDLVFFSDFKVVFMSQSELLPRAFLLQGVQFTIKTLLFFSMFFSLCKMLKILKIYSASLIEAHRKSIS